MLLDLWPRVIVPVNVGGTQHGQRATPRQRDLIRERRLLEEDLLVVLGAL